MASSAAAAVELIAGTLATLAAGVGAAAVLAAVTLLPVDGGRTGERIRLGPAGRRLARGGGFAAVAGAAPALVWLLAGDAAVASSICFALCALCGAGALRLRRASTGLAVGGGLIAATVIPVAVVAAEAMPLFDVVCAAVLLVAGTLLTGIALPEILRLRTRRPSGRVLLVAAAAAATMGGLLGRHSGMPHLAHAPADPPSVGTLLVPHLDAVGATAAVLLSAGYLAGVVRLSRRGDAWPRRRVALFAAGVAAILLVTCTGIGRYSGAVFSIHMVQHMVLNMVAPALLALGAPVTLALRSVGVRDRRLLLAVLNSRPARIVAHPYAVTGIFVLSLYALYFTPLFGLLMPSPWGHAAMLAHFLISGGLYFWLVLEVDPRPPSRAASLRIPLLLLVMLSHTLFSVVLVFGSTLIAGEYFAALELPWTLPRYADQALAGGIAWTLGELVTVAVLAGVIVQWFRAAERADRARRRQLARTRSPAGATGVADAAPPVR